MAAEYIVNSIIILLMAYSNNSIYKTLKQKKIVNCTYCIKIRNASIIFNAQTEYIHIIL